MGDSVVAGFVHLLSIHQREGKGLESSMDVHEIESSNWSGLGNECDVSGNEVCSADMIDEDGVVKIVSLGEKAIKRVSELGRKDYCFPFGMVSGGVEVGHRVMETAFEVWVRGGSPGGLGAFGRL